MPITNAIATPFLRQNRTWYVADTIITLLALNRMLTSVCIAFGYAARTDFKRICTVHWTGNKKTKKTKKKNEKKKRYPNYIDVCIGGKGLRKGYTKILFRHKISMWLANNRRERTGRVQRCRRRSYILLLFRRSR